MPCAMGGFGCGLCVWVAIHRVESKARDTEARLAARSNLDFSVEFNWHMLVSKRMHAGRDLARDTDTMDLIVLVAAVLLVQRMAPWWH